MSRQKNTVAASRGKTTTGKTLAELSHFEQVVAAFIGRTGLDAMKAGTYEIANWLHALAECKVKHPHESETKQRNRIAGLFGDYRAKLDALLLEAARTQDGTSLRLLADAIELTGSRPPQNPTDIALLGLKARGAKPMTAREVRAKIRQTQPDKTPTEKTVHRRAKILAAPIVEGKRGPAKGTKQKFSVHRSRR